MTLKAGDALVIAGGILAAGLAAWAASKAVGYFMTPKAPAK